MGCWVLLPPLSLKEGCRCGSWNPERRLCWDRWELQPLVEECSRCPAVAKAARGQTYPRSFPLTFQSPASPPVPMAKTNRKLEGNGIFNPETTTAQGKTENGEDGFEGQQEHPTVRRGMCQMCNSLNSRGHQTELASDNQSGARLHVPLLDLSLPLVCTEGGSLGTGGSRLQGNSHRCARSLCVLATPLGTAGALAVAQTGNSQVPARQTDPVAQTYGLKKETVKYPLPKSNV